MRGPNYIVHKLVRVHCDTTIESTDSGRIRANQTQAVLWTTKLSDKTPIYGAELLRLTVAGSRRQPTRLKISLHQENKHKHNLRIAMIITAKEKLYVLLCAQGHAFLSPGEENKPNNPS